MYIELIAKISDDQRVKLLVLVLLNMPGPYLNVIIFEICRRYSWKWYPLLIRCNVLSDMGQCIHHEMKKNLRPIGGLAPP